MVENLICLNIMVFNKKYTSRNSLMPIAGTPTCRDLQEPNFMSKIIFFGHYDFLLFYYKKLHMKH